MNNTFFSSFRRFSCFFLMIVYLFSFSPFQTVSQAEADAGDVPSLWEPVDESHYVPSRTRIDGLPEDEAYLYIATYFMPVEQLCDLAGIAVKAAFHDDVFVLEGDGFSLSYQKGSQYICINHRYFWREYGYFVYHGRIFIPVGLAEKIFHVEAHIVNCEVIVNPDGITVDPPDSDYYALLFGEENWYWLTHAIYAESYRECLDARICVGNVILNRLHCDAYPDTVRGVIFDTVGGQQFDCVDDVYLYQEPDDSSKIAAAICLEGTNLVEDCMFFVIPEFASTRWFDENLEYYGDVGNIVFYR